MLRSDATPWRYVSRRTPKPRAMWSGRRLLRRLPRLLLGAARRGRHGSVQFVICTDAGFEDAMATLDAYYERAADEGAP